jgi:membrane protein DedA with SNARE-associated domain
VSESWHEYLGQLIQHYGYYALFLGTLLEGETIMLLAGIAAKAGDLDIWWVIPIGFAGSLTGDQTIFFVSRYVFFRRRRADDIFANHPVWQPRIARINRILDRHGTWFILSFRFYYGLRNITPVVIAASSVRTARFVVLNVMGAIVWSVSVGMGGYLFGHAVQVATGKLKFVILGVAALAVLVWVIRHLYLRYRTKRAMCLVKDKPADLP